MPGFHFPSTITTIRNIAGSTLLVVMNNDTIEPGGGFATHPHENAEIFTYVISGKLEHRDSRKRVSYTPGNLQYMSAGSGSNSQRIQSITGSSHSNSIKSGFYPSESGGALGIRKRNWEPARLVTVSNSCFLEMVSTIPPKFDRTRNFILVN